MRILFFTCDYPNAFEPRKGPFNAALVRALRENGHDVEVVSPVSWLTRFRGGGRRNEIAEPRVARPTYFYPPKVLRRFYGSFYWWSIRRVVRALIAQREPDAVLAYWAHPDGAAAVRAARSCGSTSAIIVGGSDVLSITHNAPRKRRVTDALRSADLVLTVNQHLRIATIALGVEPSRVIAWSQGVNTKIFQPGDRIDARTKLSIPADRRALLWVGRMVPVKGLDVLLDALARRRSIDAHLYLVGDGPLRPMLEARVRELHLERDVTFVGGCAPEALADWYRAANVVVLPSRTEGLPNVLREAIACGRRFVASDVGGIGEIARADVDLLVRANDPTALAKALEQSLQLSDPEVTSTTALPTWNESAEALVTTLRAAAGFSPPVVNSASHVDDAQTSEFKPATEGALS